jgi:hypothetical protein
MISTRSAGMTQAVTSTGAPVRVAARPGTALSRDISTDAAPGQGLDFFASYMVHWASAPFWSPAHGEVAADEIGDRVDGGLDGERVAAPRLQDVRASTAPLARGSRRGLPCSNLCHGRSATADPQQHSDPSHSPQPGARLSRLTLPFLLRSPLDGGASDSVTTRAIDARGCDKPGGRAGARTLGTSPAQPNPFNRQWSGPAPSRATGTGTRFLLCRQSSSANPADSALSEYGTGLVLGGTHERQPGTDDRPVHG